MISIPKTQNSVADPDCWLWFWASGSGLPVKEKGKLRNFRNQKKTTQLNYAVVCCSLLKPISENS